MHAGRLWGGRFDELPPGEMVDFLSGRDVKALPACDERLIPYDLWGNRAHVVMLCRQGILTRVEARKILRTFKELEGLCRKGRFSLDPSKEDVHSNIESYLIDRIGLDTGGKVHTGRSRNDQVALDMRLYLRDQALGVAGDLLALLATLTSRGEEFRSAFMPGYTHHQHATATTFGHLLLSFAEAFERDLRRFIHWVSLFNMSPLGAAAGYGTTFPLDRRLTARLLGFDGPTENVTDSITQRWEPEAELAYGISVMLDHLSSLAQTFIILSTGEFGMIRLHDRHCSGSSIMPQKRNPDSLEVIKAKASFALGMTVSLLSVGRGLFMGYNRETQWTKYWIMDLADESRPCLPVMTDVVRLLDIRPETMDREARSGFIGSTALMEWMVGRGGLAMRQAKRVVERAVRYSEEGGGEEVTLPGLEKALAEFDIGLAVTEADVEEIQSPEWALGHGRVVGSPSAKGIRDNLRSLRTKMTKGQRWLEGRRKGLDRSRKLLEKMEKEILGAH
jgi:argininosuccinate lyase